MTRGFRPDIQALRAIAVTLVVLNHLWPQRLAGGYVGVDVFFVISGFLITAHLSREVFETGTVRLGRFYARRARRLLPAALLVLALSLIATWMLLPASEWSRSAAEVLASAFYVENWFLVAQSVDYSAQNDAATVAQHYWSLSVEEQFYLLWPVTLIVLWFAVRRVTDERKRRLGLLAALTALGVASLLASCWMTAVSPSQAYFATPTRVWEFVAGGLLALGGARIPSRWRLADIASILGFTMILCSAILFGEQTPFPGIAAMLPVIGTVLVIAAGSGSARLLHLAVSSRRPVQWLGDVSYSIYLWHWPLIVVAPFLLARSLTTSDKLGLIVVTLVLAAATRRFVEVPGQRWAPLRDSARRTLIATASGMAVIGLLSCAVFASEAAQPDMSGEVAVAAPSIEPCRGPQALERPGDCDVSASPQQPTMGARNAYYQTPAECGDLLDLLAVGDALTTRRCDFSEDGEGSLEVWLVGDSHAQQWQWPIFDMARARGWDLTISFLGGCPPAAVDFVGFGGDTTQATAERCETWSAEAADVIDAERPDLVFTSSFTRAQVVDDGKGESQQQQYADGFAEYWDRWTANGTRVVVIGDPPMNGAVRDPNCVVLRSAAVGECGVARSIAQPPDPMLQAAEDYGDPDVVGVDVTASFCDDETCYASVGGIPVYYDADHLNVEFARLIRPKLEAAIPVDSATASVRG